MSSDAWPSPDAQPGPLPRIEELPIAEQGYEQEAVRAAFDSFYRHAAQLDASLSALEAVEVFRRDADALRNDLRAIRTLSFGAGDEPSWATERYERVRPEISTVAIRLVAEAALIIAVAVVAGVSHLANTTIVILMAAAFVIVACAEWLAARARYVAPAEGFIAGDLLESAPYVEAPVPAAEWGSTAAAVEPDEETEPEALTVIGVPAPGDTDPVDGPDVDGFAGDAPNVDPWEQTDEPDAVEETASPGFLRRLRR
jgi:hypothetical protein